LALDSHCRLVWQARLDGFTGASPALADILGNGLLDVIEGTANGWVYALNGATGSVMWRTAVGGSVLGGAVTLRTAARYQDVVVASTAGAEILDGRTGRLLSSIERGVGLQNCALVTQGRGGSVGITVAGYNSRDIGTVEHFTIEHWSARSAEGPGTWPMFHHDPHLSGNAQAPTI
jgi:outer membrane protein assembly factor BamB